MNEGYIQIGDKTYKESEVVMLATDDVTFLAIQYQGLDKPDKIFFYPHSKPKSGFQHLYFLSNDEIKEGDWKYNERINIVLQHQRDGKNLPDGMKVAASWCKKVIASTDNNICYPTGNGNIDSSDPLPRPSNDFLEKYVELGGIDNLMVEYYSTGVSVTSGVVDYYYKLKISPDNTITVKPVEEKTYTTKEVESLLYKAKAFQEQPIFGRCFEKWIEENLK